MARPTHHKYHIGEKDPLKAGNMTVVRREKPLNVSAGEPRETSPRQMTPVAPTYRGMLAQDYWNKATGIVSDNPGLSFLAACGLGFLIGQGLTSASRKRTSGS